MFSRGNILFSNLNSFENILMLLYKGHPKRDILKRISFNMIFIKKYFNFSINMN